MKCIGVESVAFVKAFGSAAMQYTSISFVYHDRIRPSPRLAWRLVYVTAVSLHGHQFVEKKLISDLVFLEAFRLREKPNPKINQFLTRVFLGP